MFETPTKREYVRTDNWAVVAKICKDENAGQWFDVLVPDVSSGGLLFLTDLEFMKDDALSFDLQIDPMTPGIYGIIRMKAKGAVRGDRGVRNGKRAFSVEFTEMSETDKIRLDELIRLTNFRYKMDEGTTIFDR